MRAAWLLSSLITAMPAQAGENAQCLATAIEDTAAVFRDEGMLWNQCAYFPDGSGCAVKKGEAITVVGMALLPRYTTQMFFLVRAHETFECYPAQTLALDAQCDADLLPVSIGEACEPK